MQIIAEVKTHSPFGWKSSESWDELFELANAVGDMLSIHTDKRWGGSFNLVREARKRTNKPILAKGIHASDEDIDAALSAGADYVLVVGRMPNKHQDVCLIEPYTINELSAVPSVLKAIWNSRDLKTGGLKQDTFSEARNVFTGWLCQASNIQTISDVDPSADAVLVGTHLKSFADSLSRN